MLAFLCHIKYCLLHWLCRQKYHLIIYVCLSCIVKLEAKDLNNAIRFHSFIFTDELTICLYVFSQTEMIRVDCLGSPRLIAT